MKRQKNLRIKVVHTKLGREKVWGDADTIVRIDSRLKGKKKLEVCLHECFHVLFPELSEAEIESKSIRLTKTLWHENWRSIETVEKEIPLQDGSK